MWKGDGDGGVREGVGGPQTDGVGDSGKGWYGRPTQGALGFKQKWEVCGLKTGQRRDVRGNVATFQRVNFPSSRRWISTSRHSREVQNQCRDVGISCHDVPERFKINVATLGSHVATFQSRVKLTSRR